ncbi:MAG: hypothetical protein IKJ04_00705 [Clostridia bacterium]|nr:hypothetical protein [Clostridia bacterium]
MAKVRKQHIDPKHTFIATVPRILLTTIISGLFLLFISALIAFNSHNALMLAGILPPICLLIASVIGGYISGRTSDKSTAYLCTLTSSVTLVILITVIRLILPSANCDLAPTLSFFFHLLLIALSLLGVLLSGRTRSSAKKKRHRTRRLK